VVRPELFIRAMNRSMMSGGVGFTSGCIIFFLAISQITLFLSGEVEQLVARMAHNHQVTGSSPVFATGMVSTHTKAATEMMRLFTLRQD
jgi:hypothetical protein